MRHGVIPGILAASVLFTSVAVAAPATATLPGENGRIVYVDEIPTGVPDFEATEIFSIDPNGSDVRRLTHDAGRYLGDSDGSISSNQGPKWSPDGLFIAYIHVDEWDHYSVRLMDADGTLVRTITDEFRPVRSLSWSPDGKHIALEGTMIGGAYRNGIWVITESGDDPRVLVQTPSGSADGLWDIGDPAWSPTGRTIAFAARPPSAQALLFNRLIYAVDSDGSNLRPLPCGSGWSWDPEWTASGNYLLCTTGALTAPDLWIAQSSGDGTWPFITAAGSQGNATPAPADTDTLYTSAAGDAKSLMSYFDGYVADFTGHALDWQAIHRFAQPTGLFDPNTGKWYLTSLHGMIYSFFFGNPADYPIMGDWDCDGIDTPGLYRQSDGYVYLRNSNTQGVANIKFYFGNPGDLPLAGDFNGDGCDTVSIYRQSDGRVYLMNHLGANDGGLGAADDAFYFGNPGDKPFVGDFDGDGTDTVGLHRESTGYVYFRNTNTQGVADHQFYFGDPADHLIAGDWNDDGMDTPAIYRPSDRTFYLRYTNTQGNADEQFTWGQSHWLPVTGNFGPP